MPWRDAQRGADDGLIERDEHRHERDAEHREQRLPERQNLPARMVGGGMNGHFLIQQRLTRQRLIIIARSDPLHWGVVRRQCPQS